MKCKTKRNDLKKCLWVLLILFAACFYGCKDDDVSVTPYDPSKPVEVTDFTPKSGGGKTRMIIYGSNFGTDTSIASVKIGGKDAPVINVKGNCLYCMVPTKCYEGTLEVTIGNETIIASEKFTYERQMVVSTLYGDTRENDGDCDVADEYFDESFGKAHGVKEPTWFSFDPKNYPNILYLAQDNGKPLRILDLKEQKISTGLATGTAGTGRFRTIDWTQSGDTMIIANDGGSGGSDDQTVTSSIFVTRANDFKNPQVLALGKQCNGSAVHPKNFELYYNSYTKGDLYRYDFNKWGVNQSMEHREFLCTIQDNSWEFNIVMHPSGDYAYIVVINQHYIMRMNYNWDTKKFGTPYLVCGAVGSSGWEDKVGTNARLSSPYQGVFVKNEEYAKEGKEDQYDFYFCDSGNQAVRILTPDGLVTTFAGRGSLGVNSDAHGYIDGALRDEARFHNPRALAYDSINNVFYVGDMDNHRIRKIALEDVDEVEENN